MLDTLKTLTLLWLVIINASLTHAQPAPWFTGPLLAGSGKTFSKGHINLETYASYNDTFALYGNNWQVRKVPDTKTLNVSPVIIYGLTDYMDISTNIPVDRHSLQNKNKTNFSDLSGGMGIQLLSPSQNSYLPFIRFTITETFPTAPYEHLSSSLNGVDAFGAGSYQTKLGVNLQKLLLLNNDHYLRTRCTVTYNIPRHVNIHGFNTYGGGFNTSGMIRPGNQFQADMAFEYQLTQNFVPVFEVNYVQREASSFSGTLGTTSLGGQASVGHAKEQLLSILPALEYNFSANVGIIAGGWVSLKGKNAPDFREAMIALSIVA